MEIIFSEGAAELSTAQLGNRLVDELQECGLSLSDIIREIAAACEDEICAALLKQAASRAAYLIERDAARAEQVLDLNAASRCRCLKWQLHNGGADCPQPGELRYDNEGIYCGLFCEECWRHSGFRVATDPTYRFDPAEAGESLDED